MRISDWSSDVCSSDLSKADVAISKSARPLLNVRFCDLNPDGPLSRTSAFGQHLAFPPSAQNCFPHSSAHDPRGSGIEDFLTPGGVRNSQRSRSDRFSAVNHKSGHWTDILDRKSTRMNTSHT